MLRRAFLVLALLAAIAAILVSRQTPQDADNPHEPPLRKGRNNTILFITDAAQGLSNVHIATSYALLEHHPGVQVHYASFPALEADLKNVSAHAQRKNPAANPIEWHELPGADFVTAAMRSWGSSEGIVGPPGLKGVSKLVQDMEMSMSPWTVEEHWALYTAVRELIQQVDPAIVVLDQMLHPALDAARTLRRAQAIISPNAAADLLIGLQPRGSMFWKYPALGSGHPFPMALWQIPANMYILIRIAYAVLKSPTVTAKQEVLIQRGVDNPVNFFGIHQTDVPWFIASLPEASLPLEHTPSHVGSYGPIVRDVAPLDEQDPGLASWMRQAPTVLINLGSQVRYTEERATALALALVPVLEQTGAQVLWKFRKLGEFDDGFLEPVQEYIKTGRLQLESWFTADPVTILTSGHVALSVHHGGASCFHETVFAGVPQVILPLWVDHYNYARLVEYLGIGLWPGQDTAPQWKPQALSNGFLEALGEVKGSVLKKKAHALGEVARSYDGRNAVASELAKLVLVD